MALVRLDILEGKSEAFVASLLDATHRAMVQAFDLSGQERYQVVSAHPPEHMVVEDTGLGIARSDNVVIVNVTSRPGSETAKLRFYEALCNELQNSCGISPSDVVVLLTPDWTTGIPGRCF